MRHPKRRANMLYKLRRRGIRCNVTKQKTKMKISKWRITAFVGWIVATLIVVSATLRGISKADTATNLISAASLLAWVLLSLATNCFTFKNNKNEKN